MNNIKIRKAIYTDCHELSLLKREVWETTYRGIYPDEKINNYDYIKNEEKFKGFIDNPSKQLYVAVNNNKIIGFIGVDISGFRFNLFLNRRHRFI